MGLDSNEIGDVVHAAVRERRDAAPVRQERGALCLEDVVAAIPEGYQPGEAGWGSVTGREVW